MGYNKTAINLYDNLMMDQPLSIAQRVDFGMEKDPALYGVYQDAIRKGTITLNDLIRCSCNGPLLSELVGRPIVTMWDNLTEEEDDE